MMWLNWSVAKINATLQLLDIYRLDKEWSICQERATGFEFVPIGVIGLNLSIQVVTM